MQNNENMSIGLPLRKSSKMQFRLKSKNTAFLRKNAAEIKIYPQGVVSAITGSPALRNYVRGVARSGRGVARGGQEVLPSGLGCPCHGPAPMR